MQLNLNDEEAKLIKDALGFYGHYCSSITWVASLGSPDVSLPETWRTAVHANGGKAYNLLDRIRRIDSELYDATKSSTGNK